MTSSTEPERQRPEHPGQHREGAELGQTGQYRSCGGGPAGRPGDLRHYVGEFARRYCGSGEAIEIWNDLLHYEGATTAGSQPLRDLWRRALSRHHSSASALADGRGERRR